MISITPYQSIAYEEVALTYWLYTGDLKAARAALESCPMEGIAYTAFFYWLRQELYERNYTKALEIISKIPTESYQGELIFIPKSLLRGYFYELLHEPELARTSYEEARALLEAKAAENPDDERVRSSLGLAYAGLGRKEEAVREGELGLELSPVEKDAIAGTFRVEDLAFIYTMVGEYDKALEQIEHLLSIPSLFSVSMLRIDTRFDPLREHPRYQEIVDKYSGDVH
jgi:tetratricopeptide (TPR) repeat protein